MLLIYTQCLIDSQTMTTSEKFCLKWNDFKDNVSNSFAFLNLFRRNKHVHPLIYMRGMKYDDLVAIVDFL